MKYYERKDCRLCKSTDFRRALELTATPWADDYVSEEHLNKVHEIIPLIIQICKSCGHGQLTHVIDAKEVYLNYTYETASTLGLGDHFEESAKFIIENFKVDRSSVAIDIGSNDGILLKYFKDYGMEVLGIDPMPGIAEKATKSGIPTLPDFFDTNTVEKIINKYGKASIITSNNLVADTDDLDDFIKNIKLLMDKKSVFFFETFYFYLQIKNFVWDFTYHEHYSYFTIEPLISYFKKFEMEIIDVTPNLTKGGSMRCVLQLINGENQINPSVEKYVKLENQFGFPYPDLFQRYETKIQESKVLFLKEINKLKKQGKKIAGYGASATSTTLIYHYEMGEILDCLYDDFQVKQGLYSPGFHIPVYDSNLIYEHKPDYIIVLAWRYYKKIVSKHPEYTKLGGKFILPLPEYKVI